MFVDECRHRDLVGPYATAAERSEWDIRKLDILAAANREPDRLTRDGKGLEWRPPAWALLAKAERLIARGTYDLQPRPDEWHLRTPAHLGTRKASLRT
jgi:hypothetical protein